MTRILKNILDLIKETIEAWSKDKASRLAAALAYYAIFSIAPLLIVIIAITGLIFGESAARDEIAHQIEGLVGREAAAMIQTMIANINNPASGIIASIIGVSTILFGASGLFNQVQSALNTIWHAPPRQDKGITSFVKQRLTHFAMVFGVGAVLLFSLFTDIVLTAISEYFGIDPLPQARNFSTLFVTTTLLFAVIYKVLPDVKIAWRDVAIGAAVTALLFNAGKILIGSYMGRSSVGSAYGAAGSLVVLLVWIYYSMQIFLLGAEFTHVYALKFGSQVTCAGQPIGTNEEEPSRAESEPEEQPFANADNGQIMAVEDTAMAVEDTAVALENTATTEPPAITSDDEDHAPIPEQVQKAKRTSKILTVASIVGSLIASGLGAHWLYRKRKNKKEPV